MAEIVTAWPELSAVVRAKLLEIVWGGEGIGLFMAVDMIVLGVAGFTAGYLGFFFIGFSLKAKSWPGMFALDIGCFIGICLIKGSRGIL